MENLSDEVQKEEDTFGIGSALEMFTEYDEVYGMILNLKNIISEASVEREYEKFVDILKLYHEQPHLLDPKLDSLLSQCLSLIRDKASCDKLRHAAFKYMYVIVKVRGFKTIIKHLPHEVTDFEMVLNLLEAQDPNNSAEWTTRYVLLLWMSILVMIPFHLSKFDAFDSTTQDSSKSAMNRILELCKSYIVVPDKCRDAAAYLTAKFVTRSDVKTRNLDAFISWCMDVSVKENASLFMHYGTLSAIAMIFKHGKRDDILPYARKLLQWLIGGDFIKSNASGIQKLACKITQRLGLTFLPPRVAVWRYDRGNRSLAANLSAGDNTTKGITTLSTEGGNECDMEANFDVPDEIEEVIDQLTQALGSADSIVRWSAAKGIGRVAGRLPKDLADEVVGSILELFSPRETDSSWHGGCLALAELGRRGLLLPHRLSEVVPIIQKALVYDEPRGCSSVGSHIRDSACYVCWAFARAYDVAVLQPYVQDIAGQLLIVTCFDREINCRRAASAAFQENVGRQGIFPHGIDILTAADFYAVSARNNAYLNISVFIAKYPEYTKRMIDHLVERKLDHWDVAIREVASEALHNLTPLATDYIVTTVLPSLFSRVDSIDLNTRHGITLALSDIFHALSIIAKQQNKTIGDVLPPELINKMRGLIPLFKQKLYFRGLGGELMKQACAHCVEKCALAHMPYHEDDEILEEWLSLLNDCLIYDAPAVRTPALHALPAFLAEYYPSNPTKQATLIASFISNLSSTQQQIIRMSYALALGSLPRFMLLEHLDSIMGGLLGMLEIKQATSTWAESRRDGIKALTGVVSGMEQDIDTILTQSHLDRIITAFLVGLDEYTQDKRGDIGAWVREAAMSGLQAIIQILHRRKPEFLTEEVLVKVCTGIARQGVEKIDRTRALAGKIFSSLIHSDPPIPFIPNQADIKRIIPKDAKDLYNWNSAGFTFPKFVQLIEFEPYTYSILLGLVTSVGGLTETLVNTASPALFDQLHKLQRKKGPEEIYKICDVILKIFENYQKSDRITIAMFRFLEKMFSSGSISVVLNDNDSQFARKALKLIQLEINGCRDIYKLIDGIAILCQFLQVQTDVATTALVQLSIMLCHKQSYVRRSTATRVHEAMLIYGDNSIIPIDNLEDALNLVSNTNWEDPVDDIKPIRNNLCTLLGIRVPVAKKKVA